MNTRILSRILLSKKRPPHKKSKSWAESRSDYVAPPIDGFLRKSQLIYITDFVLTGRTWSDIQRQVLITKRTFFRRIVNIFFLVKTLIFRVHQSTLLIVCVHFVAIRLNNYQLFKNPSSTTISLLFFFCSSHALRVSDRFCCSNLSSIFAFSFSNSSIVGVLRCLNLIT